MGTTARIPYADTALPSAGATVTIFNTVNQFPAGNMCPLFGMKRLQIDIFNSQAGTLNWFKSFGHRGATSDATTWAQIGTLPLPLVAGGATNTVDILIEEYEEFKVEFVNGGSNQTVFDVDVALTDERNKGT